MRLLPLIALVALLGCISGCTSYGAFKTVAETRVKEANDSYRDTIKASICSVTIGSAFRDADYFEIAKKACPPVRAADNAAM